MIVEITVDVDSLVDLHNELHNIPYNDLQSALTQMGLFPDDEDFATFSLEEAYTGEPGRMRMQIILHRDGWLPDSATMEKAREEFPDE